MKTTVLSQLLVALSVSATKVGLHNITWVDTPTIHPESFHRPRNRIVGAP